MSNKRRSLPKLTRPRLHAALPRERLFRLLDEKRQHPLVWVSGPPGSGKTTLVASYLELARTPALWYQVDRGDSDPATLFYYLAQAVCAAAPRKGKRLPLLTPEYLPDLEGFARRFLRNAFAALPDGALMVFDNYHEIAAESPVHRALHAALAEVPDGANAIVVSRAAPPALYARSRLADTLVTLDWDDLRLSLAETAAIAATRVSGLRPELLEAIHGRADGWAAGVRLLLDRLEVDTSPAAIADLRSLDATFDYFAAEVFDAAPEQTQLLLLKTALLPRFTAGIAAAVSGADRADRILEELYRRRLFVERRVGVETTYQYHDLFRAFLRSRAEQRFPRDEIASLARTCADLLLTAGFAEEAFRLYVEGEDWARAEQIFVDHAPALIAQGRWQTLEDWGKALPAKRVESNPWLRYWLGRSKTLVDPGAARLILEGAYADFAARGEPTAQLLSAAAVLDALHFEVNAFQLIRPWLERLAGLIAMPGAELAAEDELRIHAAVMMASSHLAMPGPALTTAVEKVKALLGRCGDANLTLSVANMMHYYCGHCLDLDANRVAMREARPLLARADVSADRLALYWLAEGHAHYMFYRYRDALACFDQADAIIEEHGLAQRALVAGAWRSQTEAACGDVRAAKATLTRTEQGVAGEHGFMSALFTFSKSVVAMAAGEVEHSLELGLAARERNRATGSPISDALWLLRLAYRLVAVGRIEQAAAFLAQQEARPEQVGYCRLGASLALLRAWVALRRGEASRSQAELCAAMTLARDERERPRMRWFPLALAELLPIGLDRGSGRDVAALLIAECGLQPPDRCLESWPWPVRIHTLGRFEVQLDGKPMPVGRKAPRRTIALLKALIAFGGKDVPEQRLSDALWPDLEGDAAHESLAAALHRLRRLLGANQVILQSNRTLSLDPQRCFVDALAFEAGLTRPETEQAAMRLYRGSFLPADVDAQWSISARERLRGKFVRALQASAQRLEGEQRFEEASELYWRGLEADDLVESFYQGLMRSYGSLRRTAEAAAVFERLTRTLATTLGATPALESRRLFQAISAVSPGQ